MSRPRAECRNEVKTRLRDAAYTRMQEFKRLNFITSDSAALERIVEMLLFGIVPTPCETVSDDQGRNGPHAHA